MICPSCTTPNGERHKFCHECGRPLDAAKTTASSGGEVAASPPDALARPDEAAQALRLVEQAFEEYDAARYEDALAACQAALVLDPTGSTAHSLLGMIYERLGKPAEAVQHYQMVLAMNPASVADSVKLDALLSQKPAEDGHSRRRPSIPLLTGGRLPTVAGAAAAAVVLVAGFVLTSRAVGPSTGNRRVAAHAVQGPQPGAALPRQAAPGTGMPGAAESLGRSTATGAAMPATSPQGVRLGAGLPAPPSSNAWPGLRGAYPPMSPMTRSAQAGPSGAVPGAAYPAAVQPRQTQMRRDARMGYLPPAPIQGVERLDPRQSTALTQVPGAALPAFPGTPAQRNAAGVPVLPPASAGQSRYGPAPGTDARIDTTLSAPQHPQPPAAAPPPSASISIQPLDDSSSREATRGMRQSASPDQRAASLAEALQHQRMAAYYRRQGDYQAARDEYAYAHNLFRSVQQRGGRDGAAAAEGAAAAQLGFSRLQGP